VSTWSPIPPLSADDELERADALLGQADALLRRHRGNEDDTHTHRAPEPLPLDDEDLPILTDIVEDADLDSLGVPAMETHPQHDPWALGNDPGHPPANAAFVAPPSQPSPPAPPPAGQQTNAPRAHINDASVVAARAALIEHLIELDTDVARKLEAWLDEELPQIVSRELDSLAERIRTEALAQMRATLLPALASRIAERIDKLVD
jgi:hypothetical protein